MLRIAMVAGEASGDLLASDLILALKKLDSNIVVEGVGGPRMRDAGCEILYPSDRLAVMGIVEVAGRYLELLQIRNHLKTHFTMHPPDVFIGIDAPDFNLDLEVFLRNRGIRTAHYVGPSVWAWRRGRINKIKNAVDLMMVLFPFEQEIYDQSQIPVEFVGHPLADSIRADFVKKEIREDLGIDPQRKTVAFMPGSRGTELAEMLPIHLKIIEYCYENHPDMIFISSVLSQQTADYIAETISRHNSNIDYKVYVKRSEAVLKAADAAVLTSGTITLEALLCGVPMVVGYRVNWLSYLIIRAMVDVDYVSLPNLLADKALVRECIQGKCEPKLMALELLSLLEDPEKARVQQQAFTAIRNTIQKNASEKAANAVMELMLRE